MAKVSEKENVVIVGGGLAGITIARELSAKLDHSKYNLIMVEARPYLVYMIGGARMAVTTEKGAVDKYLLNYDKFFAAGKGTVKRAKVEKITTDQNDKGGELELSGGETIPYRVLVLATGSKWPDLVGFPDDDAEIRQLASGWQEKFKSAKDVVIVGGGAVGIELAGELRDEYPEKKITIVHGEQMLLNKAYSSRFRKFMASQLLARRIDLVLGERVKGIPPQGSGEVEFESGGKISDAGLVVSTSGPKPNTEMIGRSLGQDALGANKHVKVRPTLQLASHESIFALGDIILWDEQKQAFKAHGHASVIAANILSLLNGSKLRKEYKTGREMILVTNGKNGGGMYVGMLWGIILGNWAARQLKAKDVGLSMIVPQMTGA